MSVFESQSVFFTKTEIIRMKRQKAALSTTNMAGRKASLLRTPPNDQVFWDAFNVINHQKNPQTNFQDEVLGYEEDPRTGRLEDRHMCKKNC